MRQPAVRSRVAERKLREPAAAAHPDQVGHGGGAGRRGAATSDSRRRAAGRPAGCRRRSRWRRTARRSAAPARPAGRCRGPATGAPADTAPPSARATARRCAAARALRGGAWPDRRVEDDAHVAQRAVVVGGVVEESRIVRPVSGDDLAADRHAACRPEPGRRGSARRRGRSRRAAGRDGYERAATSNGRNERQMSHVFNRPSDDARAAEAGPDDTAPAMRGHASGSLSAVDAGLVGLARSRASS